MRLLYVICAAAGLVVGGAFMWLLVKIGEGDQ